MPAKGARRPDFSEDLRFQQRDWRIQRVAWGLLALVVAAGLAGLLGSGPLSEVKARSGEGLGVEYERYVRHGRKSELQLNIGSARVRPGRVHVAISREYVAAMEVQRVTPSPVRVQSAGRSLVYVFEHSSQTEPLKATFVIEPDRLGWHETEVAVGEGSTVSIRQFTYP